VQYLLMIGGEATGTADAAELCSEEDAVAWVAEMRRRGLYQGGVLLRPSSDATTIRVRGDEVLLTDGPYAETKEQVGGICLLECASLDEAVAAAAEHPVARLGMVEVRPMIDEPRGSL
jgi:hypothetical protein